MARATRKNAEIPAEPAGLSRERVCCEALALADEEGLGALSMRRLGARLGVEAMSLYRHVRNKDDLLDSLQGAVLAELELPKGLGADAEWRALLGGLARGLRKALLRHPNVVALFATRAVAAPEAMGIVARVWTALEHAGFAPTAARRALLAVGVYTIGHTLGEASPQPAPHLGAPNGPGLAEFTFGLEALLDGLTSHARARRRKAT